PQQAARRVDVRTVPCRFASILCALLLSMLPLRPASGACEACARRAAFASEKPPPSSGAGDRAMLRVAAARAAADARIDEADGLYRELLRLDPWDRDALAALEALSASRPLPRESAAYRQSRELLPARFVEHETPRFILLSDAETQWTRTQAGHLERAWHQFHRFARRLDMRPLPPRHKLVC